MSRASSSKRTHAAVAADRARNLEAYVAASLDMANRLLRAGYTATEARRFITDRKYMAQYGVGRCAAPT